MYTVTMSDPDDDNRTAMIITDDGGTREHWDGGEPEDNLFYRDWGWVQKELNRAYSQGLIDGEKKAKGE